MVNYRPILLPDEISIPISNTLRPMKKMSTVAAIGGLILALISAPTAAADTVGTGDCATTVTSASGVVAVTSGSSCYIAFTATGSNAFTVPSGITSVSLLIIAGGGGGGSFAFAGGGGAGELALASSYSVNSSTAVSISVGTGGTSSGSASGSSSTSGSNSWVGSSTGTVANGGGFGGSHNVSSSAGGNGGSGGGEGENNNGPLPGASVKSTFGSATRYGNGGGTTTAAQAGGGGGGAGGSGGGVSTFGYPGNGGSGTNAVASWLSAIRSGMTSISGWATATTSGFIAGGGGGGSNNTAVADGGAGGGGAGGPISACSPSIAPVAVAGIANTGSGGGGANYACGGGRGGAGGSGLVVVRFSAPLSFPSADTFTTLENSTAVGSITASDSATISIFGGDDQAKFSITRLNDTSTSLSFISAPNFEAPTDIGLNNTYIVVFRAIDSLAGSAYETVTVSVTNINEAPTITINSSAATHALSVDEGTTAVGTYAANDVDSGTTLTWSLSGVDAAKYSINSTTGVLALLSSPDFEIPTDAGNNNTYIVVIAVTDGALSDTQTLTLTINDSNEPSYISVPTISGTPNKGAAITISVTTNAPGKVRFFVGGKRIPNCLAQSTTGSFPTFTATCSWRPSVHGTQRLSAQIIPTSSTFNSTTSEIRDIGVFRKITPR